MVELDKLFWKPGLDPARPDEWADIQRNLVEAERWVLDGDLGPYDVLLDERLAAADAAIHLDSGAGRGAVC